MPPPTSEITPRSLTVHLPAGDAARCEQDAEWCDVETPAGRRRIRFHDYAEIYAVPGLYEHLFYDVLECDSPRTIRELLAGVLAARGVAASDLTVLDLGAGNGMVGEELARIGTGSIVGVDILEAAAAAAARDRPDVYDDYLVADLTDPDPGDDATLGAAGFNCLATVAALGFGDIPPAAFARAFNYVEDGGLVAFNIKDRFTRAAGDRSGFARLLGRMQAEHVLETLAEHRYRHRLSTSGEPLRYTAHVARKVRDVPEGWG